MRIKSEIWVRAYIRRCQAEGVPVVIVRRGDEAAGAIFICIDRLDGTVLLYGPAPAGLGRKRDRRRWVQLLRTSASKRGRGQRLPGPPAEIRPRPVDRRGRGQGGAAFSRRLAVEE